VRLAGPVVFFFILFFVCFVFCCLLVVRLFFFFSFALLADAVFALSRLYFLFSLGVTLSFFDLPPFTYVSPLLCCRCGCGARVCAPGARQRLHCPLCLGATTPGALQVGPVATIPHT
jgi:hypothetical protein